MASSRPVGDNLTLYVHAGVTPDPVTGAIALPIYQSTTYVQESVEKYLEKGYSYSRCANPTVRALEIRLCALEDGADAACFNTGMASFLAVFTTYLHSGDHCVMPICLYGGSFRAANEYLTQFGIAFDFVDFRDPKKVERAIKPNTKLIFSETPGNPTFHLTDLEAIDEMIGREELLRIRQSSCDSNKTLSDDELLQSLVGGNRKTPRSMLFVVDSTFATPIMLHPFKYGADVVLHSTTKYIDGHNISTGGVAISRFADQHSKIAHTRNICGSIMHPQTAFYTLNSVITLPDRFLRQSAAAKAVAQFLQDHPKVERVVYPGLDSHPQRALALKYHRGDVNGGVLGFDVKGGTSAGVKLMNSIGYPFSLCESLGSAQSLITCPAVFTHSQMTAEERLAIGVTDGYVRLAIGLEEPDDLIEALDKALKDI